MDRAALDTAIKLELPHGGWVPRGRKTEDGRLPDRYEVQEVTSSDYRERTERNVLDADGTLIISPEPLTGGTAFTRHLVERYEKPWLHVDPMAAGEFACARAISEWVQQAGIEVLNVAGPRGSKAPELYTITCRLLESLFYLDMMQATSGPGGFSTTWARAGEAGLPATVADAVERLVSDFSLRERTAIAGTSDHEWRQYRSRMVDGLKRAFYLDRGNQALMADCREIAGKPALDADDAAVVVLDMFWKELRRTHLLRRVK